ncbi:hypothetical protein CAPTEDRAFT_145335, partial [Capitella teleta]
ILDLLLTNSPNSIKDLLHHPPLGRSDHTAISFIINQATIQTTSDTRPFFANADCSKIREELTEKEWSQQQNDIECASLPTTPKKYLPFVALSPSATSHKLTQ